MADKVNGRDIVLYYYDAGTATDIPLACSTGCSISLQTSQQEVTNINSAYFREFKPDVTSGSISVEGFIVLSTEYNYLMILQLILDRATFLVKFVIDNGVDGLAIISCNVSIESFTINGPDAQAATYSAQMRMTGAFSILGTIVTPGGIVISGTTAFASTATGVGGETVITPSPSLIGADLLYFSRGGTTVETIITGGSPNVGEALFNTVAGTITFNAAEPAAATEKFRALAQ